MENTIFTGKMIDKIGEAASTNVMKATKVLVVRYCHLRIPGFPLEVHHKMNQYLS